MMGGNREDGYCITRLSIVWRENPVIFSRRVVHLPVILSIAFCGSETPSHHSFNMVGTEGLEPSKAEPAGLQSCFFIMSRIKTKVSPFTTTGIFDKIHNN
jgi:hypothetical protein